MVNVTAKIIWLVQCKSLIFNQPNKFGGYESSEIIKHETEHD
jgi:hypothetical protein